MRARSLVSHDEDVLSIVLDALPYHHVLVAFGVCKAWRRAARATLTAWSLLDVSTRTTRVLNARDLADAGDALAALRWRDRCIDLLASDGTCASIPLALSDPWGLAEHGGFFHVCDKRKGTLHRYNRDGLCDQTREREVVEPEALTIDEDGAIYIVETDKNRVVVYTHSEERGYVRRSILGGKMGSGDGQLFFPRAVAVAPRGDVYVADTMNSRIVVFSRAGAFLRTIGHPLEPLAPRLVDRARMAPGVVDAPMNVAFVRDRGVVLEQTRVTVFTPAGALKQVVETDQFHMLWGMAVHGGRLHLSDARRKCLHSFALRSAAASS